MSGVMRGCLIEVIDPRDGAVFAIVAGHSARVSEAEALRSYSDGKATRVEAIRAAGLEPLTRAKLLRSPEEAFALKRVRCAEVGLPYRGPVTAASTDAGGSRIKDVVALLRVIADMVENGEIDGQAVLKAIERGTDGGAQAAHRVPANRRRRPVRPKPATASS